MNNVDGFNERSNYIRNSNDKRRLQQNGPIQSNSSFAEMRADEHKFDIETTTNEHVEIIEEAQGNKENFILRETNLLNAANRLRK